MLSRRTLVFGGLAALGTPLKIVSVKAWPVTLGFGWRESAPKFKSDFDPARWRYRGPLSQLAGAMIVEIKTDQGIAGYGMGGGGGAGAYIVEHHLRDLLTGSNPLRTELLWDQMYTASSYYGRRGLAIMALSGVDLALWDIAGKYARRPVHELLGGPTKEKVPAYYTGVNFETALKMGFRGFKLPIRHGVAEGKDGMKTIAADVAKLRKLVGPEADIMIDCNSLWDVPYTLEMDQRLAEYRLKWFEEPLNPDDVVGYERLCGRIRNTRIASGEHEYTRFGYTELLRHKAVQILQPDVTWSGGLTECRRIAALAAADSLPVCPHRGGCPYAMALIMSTPNCEMAESFGHGETGNEIMTAMTSRFQDGYYYPNTKPGFGIELNESILRKFSHP